MEGLGKKTLPTCALPCEPGVMHPSILLRATRFVHSLQGRELQYPLCALLSPAHRPSAFGDAAVYGQLLTLFLTLPVSGFCLIMGELHPSPATLRNLQVCACKHTRTRRHITEVVCQHQ